MLEIQDTLITRGLPADLPDSSPLRPEERGAVAGEYSHASQVASLVFYQPYR
jgi:hypothetical protein